MRTLAYPNIKTVNIDSDIFLQESPPPRSKLPLTMIKSLAERKRNKRSTHTVADRYQRHLAKVQPLAQQQQPQESSSHSLLENYHSSCKKHTKTNTDHKKYLNVTDYEHAFTKHRAKFFSTLENNHSTKKMPENTQLFQNDEQFQQIGKEQVQNHKNFFRDQVEHINPYTHQQYKYLRHRKHDQIAQIKRNSRIRRVSSITNSCKVTTIELAPQRHHRRPSFQASPTKLQSPNFSLKQAFESRTMPTKIVEGPPPSPWEWKQAEESKDFID